MIVGKLKPLDEIGFHRGLKGILIAGCGAG
jgi:hypothetical protein